MLLAGDGRGQTERREYKERKNMGILQCNGRSDSDNLSTLWKPLLSQRGEERLVFNFVEKIRRTKKCAALYCTTKEG